MKKLLLEVFLISLLYYINFMLLLWVESERFMNIGLHPSFLNVK